MPDNLPSIIMIGLMMLVSLLAFGRWMSKRLAPVKTVQAKVIDKHITKIAYSKTGAYGKRNAIAWYSRWKGRSCPSMWGDFPTMVTAKAKPVS